MSKATNIIAVLVGVSIGSLTLFQGPCSTVPMLNTNTNREPKKTTQTQGVLGDTLTAESSEKKTWPWRVQISKSVNVEGNVQITTSHGFKKWPDLDNGGRPVLARLMDKNNGVYWIVKPMVHRRSMEDDPEPGPTWALFDSQVHQGNIGL